MEQLPSSSGSGDGPGAASSAVTKAVRDPTAPTTGGPGPRKKRPQPLNFPAPKDSSRPLTEQIVEATAKTRADLGSGQSSGASLPPRAGLASSAATPQTGGSSCAATPQTSAGTAASPPAHALLAVTLATPVGSDGDAELQVHDKGDLQEIRFLGQGASGTVEKHRHVKTGKELAIKKIQAGDIAEPQQKAILLELRTFAKCRTPHIVDFYGAFLHENVIHIALEYMNGGALSDVLEVRSTVPEENLANITWQVLDGLEYLHEHMHVIHRDVKPSNLLLSLQGVVKITDFGVSGELQDELAQSNKCTWVGTIYYMSPERVEGKPYKYDSDLWSLGLTMLECLTGFYPYTDTEKSAKKSLSFWELMRRVVDDEAPRLPPDKGFSEELEHFVASVLQKERKGRPSAAAMKAHPWLHGAMDPERQSAVAAWVVGSRSDQHHEPRTLGPAAPAEPRAPPLAGSLRGGAGPFGAAPGGWGAAPPVAMGASLRGAGNPFASAGGAAAFDAGGSCGSAAGAPGALPQDAAAAAPLGASFRGGRSNPFASLGAGWAAASGPAGAPPLPAPLGGALADERLPGGEGGPGRRGPAGLRAAQPPLLPRPLSPAASSQPLRQLLQLRSALVDGQPELSAADSQLWEERVRGIASAYATPKAATGSPPRLSAGAEGPARPPTGGATLPSRVDADGPGLYIGDAASARDAEALRALGIGAVMNCGAPAADYPPGFGHLLVRCEDTEGYPLLSRHLGECLAFGDVCESEGRGLLVHCVMGLNRSATLAVAMLMLRRGTLLLESVRCVWESRGRLPILTNSSFRRQLVQLAHLTGRLG